MIMKERERILVLYHTSAPEQCFPQHIPESGWATRFDFGLHVIG